MDPPFEAGLGVGLGLLPAWIVDDPIVEIGALDLWPSTASVLQTPTQWFGFTSCR